MADMPKHAGTFLVPRSQSRDAGELRTLLTLTILHILSVIVDLDGRTSTIVKLEPSDCLAHNYNLVQVSSCQTKFERQLTSDQPASDQPASDQPASISKF